VVDRLQQRFRIRSICIVADRGMISQETIAQLEAEKRRVHFILGARLRNVAQGEGDLRGAVVAWRAFSGGSRAAG
jgi:hypothetical protein